MSLKEDTHKEDKADADETDMEVENDVVETEL